MGRVAEGALVAVLLACLFFLAHKGREEQRAYEARVAAVTAFAEQETTRADSAVAAATAASARADSLDNAAGGRAQVVRARVDEIRVVAVPDTCVPFVAPRDSLLDEALAAVAEEKQAYEEQKRATDAVRLAYGAVRVVNDSLRTVLDARPKPRPWYMPTLSITAGAGLRGLDVVVGASWEIRL